jgi:hypothetical protein
MSDMREIRVFVTPDGKRRAAIIDLGNGRFRFNEEAEVPVGAYTVMKPSHESGYYESAEAAESEARTTLRWIDAEADHGEQ